MANTLIGQMHKFFPFPKMRDEQAKAFDFIAANMDKRFFILELPTGVGKSAIAYTFAKWLLTQPSRAARPGAYLITPQKVLQEQYTRDFPELANIWSKTNYQCLHRPNMTCDVGLALAKLFPETEESKRCVDECAYIMAKRRFVNAPIGITNTAFMLHNHVYTDDLKRRQLLVVDECHNIENEIVNFVAPNFNRTHCERDLKIDLPRDFQFVDQFVSWIKDIYMEALQMAVDKIREEIIDGEYTAGAETSAALKKKDALERRQSTAFRFLGLFNEDEWVLTGDDKGYEIKPIYASRFTEKALFELGDKVLLMSATILDKDTFCSNIGIPSKDACFLSLGSPFPVDHRPVMVLPVGSMSFRNKNGTLPNLSKSVQTILAEHSGQKGIIHTHTYATAKYLVERDKTGRLVVHDSKNRVTMLRQHEAALNDSVIVSPSFTEGIDLRDDLSRFQIICKIPYPYLGDKYVKTKMERCRNWYAWMTAKTIVQSLGRSVRSSDDFAVSYILDSDWVSFYQRNRFLFPRWFIDAIVNV